MSGIGSGVGGYCAVGVGGQSGKGTQYYGTQYTPPTRFVPVKSAKATVNPHIVQGGPYVRNGAYADLGSANVATYLDAKVALTGDFMNTGMALLLAQSMGGAQNAANVAGVALGVQTSTAYTLMQGTQPGTQYANLIPQDGSWFDMEVKVQDTNGGSQYQQYESCKITKAEYTFPRDGIVSYSYDVDAAFVTFTGAQATGTQAAAPVPFTMPNSSSLFKVSTPGGVLTVIDGCKKVTVTLTPKLATDRAYIGNTYKDEPVTNGLIEVAVSFEMDYTPSANVGLFQYFASHTPIGSTTPTLALATQVWAVGNQINATGVYDTFGFQFPQLILMSGGEAPLEGVDIVKNTINLKGVIYGALYSAYATLYTADSTF